MPTVSRRQAFRLWLKLGLLSFGGPAGQIALLHHELVVQRGWVSSGDFSRGLNLCMLLPGPEALQLVIYLGWRLHGTAGGLVAGLCFVLPACLLMACLAFAYVTWGQLPGVLAALAGLKSAVLALIMYSVVRLARTSLQGRVAWMLAGSACLAMILEGGAFPWILATAAAIGWILLPADVIDAHLPSNSFSWFRAGRILLVGLMLWGLPWLLLPAAGRGGGLPADAYWLFTQAALISFGGAYPVIAWVQHQAVEVLGWISLDDAMIALGMAEATPGPLVTALQFIGFLAGWNAPGDDGPLATAIGVALLAGYATFLPSFVLILAGAAGIDWLSGQARLQGALAGVTAAAVGVMASLGWQFGASLAAASPTAMLIVIPAGLLLASGGIGAPTVILGGLASGVLLHAAGLA